MAQKNTKKLPKKTEKVLREMAKDPLGDAMERDGIIGPSEHVHSTDCQGCKVFLMDHRPQQTPIVKWQDKIVEKVVYRVDKIWALLWFLLGVCVVCTLWSSQPKQPIREPYAVYRPDKETDAKLFACQDSWREDQITKKQLRETIKRMRE